MAALFEDSPAPLWSSSDVLAATGGEYVAAPRASIGFSAVTIDSRQVGPGMLFVALKGERHDAHDFVRTALENGAATAVVDHALPGVDGRQLIRVGDTQRALGDLAAWTRRRRPLQVVAITGSNGKTTTKDFVASICAAAADDHLLGACLKTQGNFNNLIGLPLTLLGLRDEPVAVLEMGMNRFGEIARLTEIAAPNIGVITNVGPAHLEGVGGSLDGVARAKGELFDNMSASSAIAVNLDDERVVRASAPFVGRKLTFGSRGEVQGRAVVDRGLDGMRFELVIDDRAAEVSLLCVGSHNISNALAAAAVGHLMGLPIDVIARGLNHATLPLQRMQVLRLRNGVTLIDDAYNANPVSVEAALQSLGRMPGRSVVVLGDMRELGDESAHAHRVIGERAVALGVAELFLLGHEAPTIAAGARDAGLSASAIHIGLSHAAVAADVIDRWRAGDCVLVKGSHGMHMEEVVRLLQAQGDAS